MPVKIVTVPFDGINKLFQDEDPALFLLDKHVKRITPQFFHLHGEAYWTVFVEYEEIIQKPPAKHMEKMTDTQKQLYKKLLEWRKAPRRLEKWWLGFLAKSMALAQTGRDPAPTAKRFPLLSLTYINDLYSNVLAKCG